VTDALVSSSANEAEARMVRASIAAARHHVRAAGLAQRDALEHIIVSGHEQLAFTRTLDGVMASALHQLERHAPFSSDDAQAVTLRDIIVIGQRQIRFAERLRRTIERTLGEVQDTPVEALSAQVLQTMNQSVQRQANDLDQVIQAALNETDSPEQAARLEELWADTTAELLSIEGDRSEHQLVTLSASVRDARAHIRRLEAGGQTYAAQRSRLMQEAHIAKREIATLEAAEVSGRAEMIRLERRSKRTQAHRQALEAAASERKKWVERLNTELDLGPQAEDDRADLT
jgi:chromosome segregation ATPase